MAADGPGGAEAEAAVMRLNRARWLFSIACQSHHPDGHWWMGKSNHALTWWFRQRGYVEPTRVGVRITPAGREALHQAAQDHGRHGRTLSAGGGR
jgi:hypothetical protein